MSDDNIGKKVQDAEQIGTEKVGDKEIPILKSSVDFIQNMFTLGSHQN